MFTLLALLLLQPPVAEPEPPRERFRERLEVTEVVVNAVVTDRRGTPVLGLGPEAFLVREDGREVEVLSAAYYEQRSADFERLVRPGDEPPGLRLVPEGRLFILLFHDLRRTDRQTLGVASHQLRAGRDARRWIRDGLGAADRMAVASYDYRLKIHQDFTGDRRALDRAIARAVGRESAEERLPAAGAPSLLAGLPSFRERRDRSAKLREALKLLGEAVAPIDGRKHLLLFSVGIGLGGPERGLFGPFDEPTLIERLNDSDLAVYCLDTTPADVDHLLAARLGGLAAATGGEYFGHLRQFQNPLRRIEQRLSGYYLLTYRSDRPGTGFRRIEVVMRSPELVVSGRRGFLVR